MTDAPPPFPIVDIHTHLMPERLMQAVRSYFRAHLWHPWYDGPPETLVPSLLQAGIDRFVFMPYAHRDGMARSLNHWVANVASTFAPHAIGFGTFHPDDEDRGKLIPLERYDVKNISIGYLVDRHTPVIWRGPMIGKAIDQLMRDVDWSDVDMLFFDPAGRLARIKSEAVPLDETPIPGGDDIRYVLEINGGLAESLGIDLGAEIRHPALDQDAAAWSCPG